MNKVLNSKIFSLAMLAAILWLGLSLIEVGERKYVLDREIDNLEKRAENIEKDNERLENLSSYFKSAAFLEREARLKLNYKKPGEEVYFVFNEKQEKTASPSESERTEKRGILNYLNWFFDLFSK